MNEKCPCGGINLILPDLMPHGREALMSISKWLIRWYLSKETDFSKITDREVAHIESLLNNRPRKYLSACVYTQAGLGYKTPLEVASSFVTLQG
ncbi:MAG: hypothetical protein DDT22_01013 [candidate division WS2 bacterium]|nr:hypothetical protein [Candidatus Lithacetigena glycinireducens]